MARRAMEIAAAGSHNVLMSGPPGTGKSLISSCLPGILPPMTLEETLETSRIHSVLGLLEPASRWSTAARSSLRIIPPATWG